ncbi:unnamed protein product [Polarella glacialis]|uniref:Reverse transcriptase domain-containing protein n=1 Tax=Polarella glacialis TaxID=89957 RepID=A0A813FR23_POLGL|nr:unnamed protein product [Polarella glacialis]
MLRDVDLQLAGVPHIQEPDYVVTPDVLYADDTVLVSAHANRLQQHLDLLVSEGKAYGLELNWGKTVCMNINHSGRIRSPDGVFLKHVQQAVYLGGLITSSGSAAPEVNRRLGEAANSFDKLATVWKHANISKQRKLSIFIACVLPKLFYAIDSLCLLQSDRRKLDSFHSKCLRKIYGIPHSYISRVSNQAVLDISGATHLSVEFRRRQLFLLHRIAQQPCDSYVKQLTFQSGTCKPVQWNIFRKRGRPKRQWVASVFEQALSLAGGSQDEFALLLSSSTSEWRRRVISCCNEQ